MMLSRPSTRSPRPISMISSLNFGLSLRLYGRHLAAAAGRY
jgi:hypothetical protein